MKRRIVNYNQFDVVRVPFPFTERESSKNRPALVISSAKLFNGSSGHSVMAMITTATHSPWPLDCLIKDIAGAGLPTESIVRFKLFTLDHRLVRGRLGKLSGPDAENVRQNLAELTGLQTI
ncbi:MAG: type II toxin-antitoxin system PemK/MazF family toxin [Nitrospinae bacterium]|nr:type II toxin-antitoxin system PemK/MazF family toxin [Nitrospinota bacterium]